MDEPASVFALLRNPDTSPSPRRGYDREPQSFLSETEDVHCAHRVGASSAGRGRHPEIVIRASVGGTQVHRATVLHAKQFQVVLKVLRWESTASAAALKLRVREVRGQRFSRTVTMKLRYVFRALSPTVLVLLVISTRAK